MQLLFIIVIPLFIVIYTIDFCLGCLNCNVFSQLQTFPEEVGPEKI